jgi:hypothetical protein
MGDETDETDDYGYTTADVHPHRPDILPPT